MKKLLGLLNLKSDLGLPWQNQTKCINTAVYSPQAGHPTALLRTKMHETPLLDLFIFLYLFVRNRESMKQTNKQSITLVYLMSELNLGSPVHA